MTRIIEFLIALGIVAVLALAVGLSLWAMQDSALLPGLLDGLERWVPQLQIQRIERATHWVVHEQPQRVAASIGRFLAT